MAKYSEDGSRTSREDLARNKSSEQEQDPMASFHKGPMPLRGVKGHTTTTTTTTTRHLHIFYCYKLNKTVFILANFIFLMHNFVLKCT
jgi:hypothetical protein